MQKNVLQGNSALQGLGHMLPFSNYIIYSILIEVIDIFSLHREQAEKGERLKDDP